LIVEPERLDPRELYRLLISVVVPRPIAFVSTVGERGSFNVAPFSYFNLIGTRPPLLSVSIGSRAGATKDSLRNIRHAGEFVVNIVDEDLHERMVHASGDWPEDVDEFELTGLTPLPSELVKPPRVAESPAHLECQVDRIVELGESALVIGRILLVHVRDEVMTDGRVDVTKLRPIGRLGGDGYAPIREVLHLPRPRVGRSPKLHDG
jgi:flavin reductase (DIM6/NTAB) family NADH-FMN oxidoreductase RutF